MSVATTQTIPSTVAAQYKVKDISLHEFGRKEITLAEHEMPGLMATREKYGKVRTSFDAFNCDCVLILWFPQTGATSQGIETQRFIAHDCADCRPY